MPGLVFGAIAPHGDIIPELAGSRASLPMHQAMKELGRRMQDARPDVILIATPHGVRIEDAVCVSVSERAEGALSENGATISVSMAVDQDFARAVCAASDALGTPTAKAIYGASSGPASCIPLDWGAVIPLWYLGALWDAPPKIVVAMPSRTVSREALMNFGRAAAQTAKNSGKRLAFIASADWAHAHAADGPYGYHADAAAFDAFVIEAVQADDLTRLLTVPDELIENAKPDGLWQVLMLTGALEGSDLRGELLSYECPTYYGMLCAAYEPLLKESC